MKMPDVTKVQIVAIVKAGIALALALGLPLDDATQAEILALAGTLATALVIADAIIRHGRSRALASKETIEEMRVLPPPVQGP